MIKKYFKQAWQLLKENKLYSTIYIIGTALGICMVMCVSVFLYIKRGNIAPEENRSRMLYVGSMSVLPKDTTDQSNYSSLSSLQTVKQVFYPLESAEAVTASMSAFGTDFRVGRVGEERTYPKVVKLVDANYWKVFRFTFIEGEPFNEAEHASGISTAVIDQMTARQLFGENKATGAHFQLNGKEYRVSGVVKNTSYMLADTFANVWTPYTTQANYATAWGPNEILGTYKVMILASSAKDFGAIRREVEANLKAYEAGLSWNIQMKGQPDTVLTASFRMGNRPINIKKVMLTMALLILVFALVPVLNLSGLNSSRMEKRSPEIGVRKAFGGTNAQLAVQMIIENLLLTFIGGVIGLFLSYLMLSALSSVLLPPLTILELSDASAVLRASDGVTPRMLLNMEVFLVSLLAVLVVNLLSTMVPAYRYGRKNIVTALSEHRN